ncbi:uncharacterized protein EV420DRAFT_688299 [Desarmillaria tabescens]|uniref:F-box domain-containing protein n=1 Tax=Armillaria tabescens TaxID=1929756 RepID=A0AA39MG23_ARMTA|nr:uncharacterized protein EV420DRAFT_688299 [Desarmillaria tabescens]KAK0432409.1 hypothetical protein EV420DRAFT_688299 [Desarmillaria tabescens]
MSGRAYGGNSYVRAPAAQVTLSSLGTLVSSLKQQQEVQSTEIERIKSRIQSLEKENEDLRAENSDLWNEINKIKGPRFPSELCDRIIDFLHHDHKALKSCSLVCRAWIPATRFHLFECFSYEVLWRSYRNKVTVLDSSVCTLFKHVRKITVNEQGGIGSSKGIPLDWLQPLAQYFNRFTNVIDLSLLSINTTSIRYIIDSPGFTSHITQLMLHNIICSTFNDLPYILSYFSKLESLSYDVHCCDISNLCFCRQGDMTDMHAETLAPDSSPPPPPATLRVIWNDNTVSSCYSDARSALYS